MIISSIKNAGEQISMNPRMEKAFQFLQVADLENLPDGQIEIDGKQVYAIVQTYQTKTFDTTQLELEGHIKFIDIQCVVTGHEVFGWLHVADVQVTTPYDEKTDAWLSNIPVEKLNFFRLSARQIAVLYPTDMHAPQLADGKPSPVKKVVIKVAV